MPKTTIRPEFDPMAEAAMTREGMAAAHLILLEAYSIAFKAPRSAGEVRDKAHGRVRDLVKIALALVGPEAADDDPMFAQRVMDIEKQGVEW